MNLAIAVLVWLLRATCLWLDEERALYELAPTMRNATTGLSPLTACFEEEGKTHTDLDADFS